MVQRSALEQVRQSVPLPAEALGPLLGPLPAGRLAQLRARLRHHPRRNTRRRDTHRRDTRHRRHITDSNDLLLGLAARETTGEGAAAAAYFDATELRKEAPRRWRIAVLLVILHQCRSNRSRLIFVEPTPPYHR